MKGFSGAAPHPRRPPAKTNSGRASAPPSAGKASRRGRAHVAARIAGFIAAGLLLAAVVFLILFPGRLLHTLIVHKGNDAFGRDFAIDGPVSLSWRSFDPVIHAEQLRIGNAEGVQPADMVRIGRLDLRIELGKLLFGRLSLPYLYIDDFDLALEKDAQGNKNWELPLFSQGRAVTDAALPGDRHDFPVIGILRIRGGHILYRDDTRKLSLDLDIARAAGRGESDEGLRFTGKGTLQGQKLSLDVRGGSVTMLRDTSRAYPLKIDLQMGNTSVAVDGTFTDPVRMSGIDTALSLRGHNLADLFYLTGVPLPPTPPYALSGRLRKEGGVFRYDHIDGKVGDSDMEGALAFDTTGERHKLTGTLTSSYLDFDDLAGFIGAPPATGAGETAAPEQKAEARQEEAQDRLLPNVPINLTRLRASDLDVTLKANKINAPGLPLTSLDARFDLDSGLLKVDPLAMGVSGGTVKGSLTLDGRKDVPAVQADLGLRGLSLKGFFDGTRFASLSSGKFGGHIALSGRGKSLARVLADSNGDITAIMSGGTISLLLIEASGIDIAEATPLLLAQLRVRHHRHQPFRHRRDRPAPRNHRRRDRGAPERPEPLRRAHADRRQRLA
jgi:uncharacterized protein involved in outer membrane biogenesis